MMSYVSFVKLAIAMSVPLGQYLTAIPRHHKLSIQSYLLNSTTKTTTKVIHNKPDLLVWDNEQKIYQVIEFSCPCDSNLINKAIEKINTYGPLIRNLQISYLQYRFEMFPIVVRALGYVARSLITYVKQLGFEDKDAIFVTRKLQILATSGKVKICKTFLKFNEKS